MRRREEENRHLGVMQAVVDLQRREAVVQNLRGFERQRPRLELQQMVRRRAVLTLIDLREGGLRHHASARRISLGRTTAAQWRSKWQRDRLQSRPRGRPVQRLTGEMRKKVRDALVLHGPSIGVASLKTLVPGVPVRDLAIELKRYRKTWRVENQQVVETLRWTRPGTVWAMDFTEPDRPIDGPFTQMLMVRDLASRNHLWWLPLQRATGWNVYMALRSLFARYGAPLVIKVDNDKAFQIREIQKLLDRHGVILLKSPRYAPWYNGSIETGNGTAKVYIHHLAAIADHPEHWTLDDIEAARLRANYFSRPQGPDGPNADEAWERREQIGDAEREAFQIAVRERQAKLINNLRATKGSELSEDELARAERNAIESVLHEQDLLRIRRRRISPRIGRRKAS